MADDELLVKQAQRRVDLIIANLVSSLAPDARTLEKFYPAINPRLYSHHDGDMARRRILERDGYACIYCGASIADNPEVAFHVDHVIPLARGGTDAIGNLVTACHHCNTSKGDKMLDAMTQESILREVAKRNKEQGIDGGEHLHVLGAARRAQRLQKGKVNR